MKRAAFGALMLFLGLAMAPRSTVAGREEALASLCRRYEMVVANDVRYARDTAVAMAQNGDHAEASARRAFVQSMQAFRAMVCVTAPPR